MDDELPCGTKLYLGKTIPELDKRSENFPSSKIKQLSFLKLCNCCNKLVQEAEYSYDHGDQEMAYIKYSRYFTILYMIRDSKDYLENKKTVTTLLGTNTKQMEAIRRLEKLVVSLKARYGELIYQNMYEGKKGVLANASPLEEEDNGTKQRNYITCIELYKMIEETDGTRQLLIDCRLFKDYSQSHIDHKCCLNIDEQLIQHGLTSGHLANHFKTNTADLLKWKTRGDMEHTIIYDWNTNDDEPIYDSPLHILIGILNNWDPEVNYKSLKFLQGGFEEFLTLYPQFTTNPKVKPPPKIVPDKPVVSDIEYPSIADIIMKDETFKVQVKSIPIINRDTKPDSLKKFSARSINEKVEVRDKLADEALMLVKERFIIEKEVKNALIASECARDVETKQKEIQKATELEYRILQLETSIHDIEEESMIISHQITKEEVFIPDAVPIDKIKKIQEKECETQKLNEMNELLAREKRLAQTREITPTKPIIDRSVKPVTVLGDQRDLKPEPISDGVRGATGLRNLGNTCWMNAIIQCVSNTNSLAECFINRVYTKFINNMSKTKGGIVENLAHVVRNLWCGKYKTISPINLHRAIGQYYEPFGNFGQHDAHEFLGILIQWMHEDLLKMPRQKSYAHTTNSAEREWLSFLNKNESLILDLFYGQMKSTLKCKTCGYESPSFESFSNLSLELPQSNDRFDLMDCLNLYFNGELISGWNCPRCCQQRDAIKKFNITRLPPILVIHLKRFALNPKTGTFQKKNNFIRFPKEGFQMDQFIAPSEVPYMRSNRALQGKYKLYAITNHVGATGGGHYTATCRNNITDRWYLYDDYTVTPTDASKLESSSNYILFYSKLGNADLSEVTNFVA